MKKLAVYAAACALGLALTACGSSGGTATTAATTKANLTTAATSAATTTEAPETTEAVDGSASYADYMAAEMNSEVTVTCYVQATQSWWNDQITVYAQDDDGAYFMYNMACSSEDAAKLTPGTAIVVTGYKSEWGGEVEIVDATFTFAEEAAKTYAPTDLTAYLGTDALIDHQNMYSKFTDMVVEPYNVYGDAFVYKDEVMKTDDLYFKVSCNGVLYEFCVEYYLCGPDTDVYKAVENLKVGDIIDLEGFLYWYYGANVHTTAITVKGNINDKSAGALSYLEYLSAADLSEVTVEAYVVATQSWWNDTITVYAADAEGGYFFYNMACSEADAAKLTYGTKIAVTGYKSTWEGETEIVDSTFTILDGTYMAPARDLTEATSYGQDGLLVFQNHYFTINGATVAAYDESGAAFAYKDAVGKTDDLYFKVTVNGMTIDCCVEYYLCGSDTAVYKAVENLAVGDTVNLEGFLYWYKGANPHITSCTVVK